MSETLRNDALVSLRQVSKTFRLKGPLGRTVGHVDAVRSVNLDIRRGETLGLVGESGSGKTTLGRLSLSMEQPTAGSVYFRDADLASLSRTERAQARRRMQIIFQDPYSSLNPYRTALQQVSEPLEVLTDAADPRAQAIQALAEVGIAGDAVHKFPREFSGGQRQRIVIARAISVNPDYVVCDEALSALDVSIQAQILRLLQRLQREHDLTYLFISHDLAVVREICDRIAVMYRGQLLELGPPGAVFTDPQHDYTRKLLAAIPIADPLRARDPERVAAEKQAVSTVIDLGDQLRELHEVGPGHFVAR